MRRRFHDMTSLLAREWERTILVGMVALLAIVSVPSLLSLYRTPSLVPVRHPKPIARRINMRDWQCPVVDASGVFRPPYRRGPIGPGTGTDGGEKGDAGGEGSGGGDTGDGDTGDDRKKNPPPVVSIYNHGFLKSGSGEEWAFITVPVDGKGTMVPLEAGDLVHGYTVIHFDRSVAVLAGPGGERVVIGKGKTFWQR